jgi:Family of unknown function (DUF6282)
MRTVAVLITLALCLPLGAQSLSGVLDIHAHSAPDSVPRKIDAVDMAKMDQARGMRGAVLKNHYESTASLAYMVRKAVPGFEAFGGIDLNLSVGGINPAAVERMSMITGGWGRFVWMPTFDSENQVKYSKEKRPFVSVSNAGALLPAVRSVIGIIAKHNLILATGHSTAKEGLMLVREGRAQGVKHMVVTHAMIAPIHMSVDEMREAAGMGAYIEFVYNGLIGSYKEFTFADYAKAIRVVGPERCILSSDMGQMANPQHADGLVAFFAGLKKQGLTDAEIGKMSKENPARLLELGI